MSIGTSTPQGLGGEGARRGSRRSRSGAARPPSAPAARTTIVAVLGVLALTAFAFGAGPGLAAMLPTPPDATASAFTPTHSSGSQYVLIAEPTSVLIVTRSATVGRNGDVLIDLGCTAGGLEGCRGAVTISPRRASARGVPAGCGCHALGSARYHARAGRRTRVRVHISPVARRSLQRHRAVRVIVTATTVSSGQTATVDRTIVLRTRPGA